MSWSAFTKFKSFKGLDFQTETEIRMDPQTLLGVVVMINPGKVRNPRGYDEWVLTPKGNTLASILSIVEEAYDFKNISLPPGGYLKICNLFDLAESNLETALQKISDIPIQVSQYSIRHIPDNTPWIWCAWGAEKKSPELKKLMQDVLIKIPKEKIVGIKIPSESYGYYHPGFLNRAKRQNYKQKIINQILNHIPENC